MNVYDFDLTIFPTDCSLDFCLWCMRSHPKMWFTYFPRILKILLFRRTRLIPEYMFQKKFLGFLTHIKNLDEQIEKYWDKNEKRIMPWYLAQKKSDDLIISASPTCLIKPIAERLGVNYVATEFDPEYGVFLGNLMYGMEKAEYIFDNNLADKIDNFYSDSLSDTPVALCAKKAHLVKHNASVVVDWPQMDSETKEKVKDKIDTGWNIHIKED